MVSILKPPVQSLVRFLLRLCFLSSDVQDAASARARSLVETMSRAGWRGEEARKQGSKNKLGDRMLEA